MSLREGFTTGTCAAAGAKAAAIWLLTGQAPKSVEIITPLKPLLIEIKPVEKGDGFAKCAAIKDGGDDPDMTNGLEIITKLTLKKNGGIEFHAGEGVGLITKPGLKIPVGQPAINPVPRSMIQKGIFDILGHDNAIIEVSVPRGKEIAKKTFNPRLGIEGGISILGTTGIVRPMSAQALIDTIEQELNVKAAQSLDSVILTFGAMGEDALTKLGYDKNIMVQVSNFVGEGLLGAKKRGFKRITLAGHAGKLVKVAGGIFNTHSAICDCRMEIICTHAALIGAKKEVIEEIFACVTTDGAAKILRKHGLEMAWQRIADKAAIYACRKAEMTVECIMLVEGGEIYIG